jgi:CheY-like chemotaxis protein
MAQRHSAEIDIDSAPGQGTTVRLIFQATQVTGPIHWEPLERPTQSLSILIVDDDPLIIASMRATLENDGHRVTVADGGQAGMDTFIAARMRGETFSIVITDLGMPYVDGRKVAATVKANSPGTPVILLTGWGQRLSENNELPAHTDRVLSKPPKLAELRRALAELTCTAASPA